MSARVKVDGLDDLIRQMTDAPQEVRSEGYDILKEETEATGSEAAALLSQHRATGKLARSLRVVFPSSTILIGLVQIVAPHAHLQFGTKPRQTKSGANRGSMENWMKGFVSIAQRHRDRMYLRMREALVRRGYQVDEP